MKLFFPLLVSLLPMVAYSQFYSCQSSAQCHALSLPTCGQTLAGWCDFPASDQDCAAYLPGGVHVEFGPLPGVDFCSRKCSSDSDCAKLSTAKHCTASSICGECQSASDCERLGFKSHICGSGYCQYPGEAGLGQCFPKSPFCGGVHCYDDSVRCWVECQATSDCPGSSNCLAGVVVDAPWKGLCVGLQSLAVSHLVKS